MVIRHTRNEIYNEIEANPEGGRPHTYTHRRASVRVIYRYLELDLNKELKSQSVLQVVFCFSDCSLLIFSSASHFSALTESAERDPTI